MPIFSIPGQHFPLFRRARGKEASSSPARSPTFQSLAYRDSLRPTVEVRYGSVACTETISGTFAYGAVNIILGLMYGIVQRIFAAHVVAANGKARYHPGSG